MPYQNVGMSKFIESSGMLRKESGLYENLLNELRKLSSTTWCAESYLSKTDLFVMENIIDMGYEQQKDPSAFFYQNQVFSLLKGLATMHACSIGYEVNNSVNIGEKFKDLLFEVTVDSSVVWYTAGIKAVLEVALTHPLYQSSVHQEFIQAKLPSLLNTLYDMVNPSTKYKNVFCHRDPWGGNVFFKSKSSNEASVFVDFQLSRYCPPALDVLLAIYMNLTPLERKQLQQQCIGSYYFDFQNELESMGLLAEQHLSRQEFEDSFREFELFGALYNCIAATILRVPGDYLKDMKLNRPEDFHHYTNVDRTKEVLELVRIDQYFREYMFDCIQDLMEIGLKL